MSTHSTCFCREIRKILCGYPLLSVAMQPMTQQAELMYGKSLVFLQDTRIPDFSTN